MSMFRDKYTGLDYANMDELVWIDKSNHSISGNWVRPINLGGTLSRVDFFYDGLHKQEANWASSPQELVAESYRFGLVEACQATYEFLDNLYGCLDWGDLPQSLYDMRAIRVYIFHPCVGNPRKIRSGTETIVSATYGDLPSPWHYGLRITYPTPNSLLPIFNNCSMGFLYLKDFYDRWHFSVDGILSNLLQEVERRRASRGQVKPG